MQARKNVVLYLKATGYKPEHADNRITEIACIAWTDGQSDESHFHSYINMEGWNLPVEAQTHLSADVLEQIRNAPTFANILNELMDFIDADHDGKTPVIVHNAIHVQRHFDFAASENDPAWTTLSEHCKLIDILEIARKKQSNQQEGKKDNTLEGLCKQYSINTSHRTCWSAVQDAQLVKRVYVEMKKAKQTQILNHSIFGGMNATGNLKPAAHAHQGAEAELTPRHGH